MKIKFLICALVMSNSFTIYGQKKLIQSTTSVQEKILPTEIYAGNSSDLTAPLVVVDGKSYGRISFCKLNDLIINGRRFDIDDIEAIDILKTQPAKSIYGAIGKNGVILITTQKNISKKGK